MPVNRLRVLLAATASVATLVTVGVSIAPQTRPTPGALSSTDGTVPAATAPGPTVGGEVSAPDRSGSPGGPMTGQPTGQPTTGPAPAGGIPATGAGIPGASSVGVRPPVVDHGPRSGNRVALTFDADMTDAMRKQLRSNRAPSYANLRIVDMLQAGQVPATFFLTGAWVEEYPEVTHRLAADPRFELANHTYRHQAFTSDCYGLPRIEPGEMTRDVARTFDLIRPYGGRQTRYFRFPGLCHDAAALAALAPLGVTVVDGDVVSGDPFATAWQPIVDAVLDRVRPGSVIVLHLTEANAPMTDEALPHILAGLAERGLAPAPLSEVLGAAGPGS